MKNTFLPVNLSEVKKRGWQDLDFVFVSGDAYVDHPSFAVALLGRWLTAHGYKVGVIPQPDVNNIES
ncbi:MAG: YgiQ family radical SAM protein, partial [Treponemataceae bacterium]|nr:YgiQ family radical SAM protein [Treponemataceae bacterium]